MNVKLLLFILTYVNLLNWIDRSIIPGAAIKIRGCLNDDSECSKRNKEKSTLNCSSSNNNAEVKECSRTCVICNVDSKCEDEEKQYGFGINHAELGMAQSTFMIGYVLGSLYFSVDSKSSKVFAMLFYGMLVWTLGVFFSFISGYTKKFGLLILGRSLSGVGEASLATISIPFLDDISPLERKGTYLAIYSSSIPVGAAIGFVYAGVISQSLSWELAYLFEIVMMLPFFIFYFLLKEDYYLKSSSLELGDVNTTMNGENVTNLRENLLLQQQQQQQQQHELNIELDSSNEEEEDTQFSESQGAVNNNSNNKIFFCSAYFFKMMRNLNKKYQILKSEIISCLESPVFVLVSFGLAGYTFTTAGLGFFMPTFFADYQPNCNWTFTETEADTVFGILVVTAGFLGTIIGGNLMDYLEKNKSTEDRLIISLFLACVLIMASLIMLIFTVFLTNKFVFVCFSWFGTVLAFSTSTPITLAIVTSVHKNNRSMSMGLSVIICHLFGDVPSPTLIGATNDKYGLKPALAVSIVGYPLALLFWYLARRAKINSL